MSNEQNADAVEAKAAAIRSQLVVTGADIRRRASPAALMESAQATFKRRVGSVPAQLSEKSFPVALVLAGGALGVIGTSLFSKRKSEQNAVRDVPSAPAASKTVSKMKAASANAAVKAHLKAAVLSAASVGFGYFVGLLLPETPTEDRLLAQPRAVFRDRANAFLQAHLQGMKSATFHLFGVSRYSAAALIGLGVLAQVISTPASKADKS